MKAPPTSNKSERRNTKKSATTIKGNIHHIYHLLLSGCFLLRLHSLKAHKMIFTMGKQKIASTHSTISKARPMPLRLLAESATT